MKLITKKPVLSKTASKVPEKPARKDNKNNKLPSDAYKDEITPIELVVDDSRKFIFSVKRGGELGLPCVDFRQYQTSDLYTGFTKKGVNFPLDLLVDVIDMLQQVYDTCDENGLLSEYEED